MALSDDSPPFAFLRQSAEDFRAAFDADVAKCLANLNAKITALMCDPDSLGGRSADSKRGNAHVEFSMAKYEILKSVKGLYEGAEKGWMDKLDQMRDGFMENVEIFLANTKLEVKLPSIGVSPRVGIIKSPSDSKVAKQSDKSPSMVSSSLYPKLFSAARNMPVLSSFVPHLEEEEMEQSSDEEQSNDEEQMKHVYSPDLKLPAKSTPRRKTMLAHAAGNFEDISLTPDVTRGKSKSKTAGGDLLNQSVSKPPAHEVEESEDDEEPIVVQTPVKRAGRGRFSAANTPASTTKETVRTPLRGRKPTVYKEMDTDSTTSSIEEIPVPVAETSRKGRRSVAPRKVVETATNSTPGKKTRTPRKKANGKVVQEPTDEDEMETEMEPSTSVQKTPKQVHFSLGLDPNEDLDIYSPEVVLPARLAPRRKTMLTHAAGNFEDISLTPEVTRGKSKRKTIGGDLLDQSVAPSPKRLKRAGGRSSLAPSASEMDLNGTNLLESEGTSDLGNYSMWIPLSDIGGTVPAQPGVYEVKVAQAKKPAYIGACDSLRQKLTLHKLAHSSGHKHLDKFVERNGANVLVRYEQMPSLSDAKSEEKSRVKNFVSCYKTTPAYN